MFLTPQTSSRYSLLEIARGQRECEAQGHESGELLNRGVLFLISYYFFLMGMFLSQGNPLKEYILVMLGIQVIMPSYP